jgi:hypothetical protein
MRKALIVFSVFVFCGFNIFAHGPQEGCTAIMGSFGFWESKTPGSFTKRTIIVAPGINYFVRDNFSVGARIALQTEVMRKVKQSTSNSIEAFGRYYFTRKVMGVKASAFLELNVGYSTAKKKPITTVQQTRAFSVGALTGFAIFPTESIGFEFSLPNLVGYYYSTFQNDFSGSKFEIGPTSVAGPKITVFFFID